MQFVNYQSFDNNRIAPTASIDASNLDSNPTAAGIQVVEGSTLAIKPNINNDVQVRNVELIVDGTVVQSTLSFPYNLSPTMPLITATKTTAIVQVRATDTGGNSNSDRKQLHTRGCKTCLYLTALRSMRS